MRFSTRTLAAALALTLFAVAPARADGPSLELPTPEVEMTEAKWQLFSQQLEHVLRSGHPGLEASALQHIITYGEHLSVEGSVVDIMRVYREGDSQAIRRMAVVALHEIELPPRRRSFVMSYLRRMAAFEDDTNVRHTMLATLRAYEDNLA